MLTLKNISFPGIRFPEFSLPDISFPEISLPGILIPEFSLSGILISEFSLPEFSLPEFSLPEFSLPGILIPDINISFIFMVFLPLIIFIKGKHDGDLLKDDIQYLLVFKDKFREVSDINEGLIIKSKTLQRNINENIKQIEYKDKQIESKDKQIDDLEHKIDALNKKKKITLPLKEPEFGTGILRMCEGGIYYHGVCYEEKQKWNENNKCSKYIYEYKSRSKNRRNLDKYKTYNIDHFCNNCLYLDEKKKYKIFKCQGHEY